MNNNITTFNCVENYEEIPFAFMHSVVNDELGKAHADTRIVRYPKVNLSNIIHGDVDGDVAPYEYRTRFESVFR